MEEKTETRSEESSGLAQGQGQREGPAERGTVIIVSRNNLHLTKKAIASALAQDMDCSVVLVDNASTDGTIQWAATKPIAKVSFWSQKSLAFCWNFALDVVFKRESHALVLNNDVEIRPDAYRMLLAHGGPFVTCVSVDSVDQMGTLGDRGIETLRNNERPNPDFSAFLIRKEVPQQAGWFNEDCYPAYVEDCFAHVAMHRAGIKAVCIDLPFLHHGAGTIKHADPAEKLAIQRGADANRQRFKQKYGCLPGSKEYEDLFLS